MVEGTPPACPVQRDNGWRTVINKNNNREWFQKNKDRYERDEGEIQVPRPRRRTEVPDAWSLLLRAEPLRKDGKESLRESGPENAVSMFERADSLQGLAEMADPAWMESTVLRGRVAAMLRGRNRGMKQRHWYRAGLDHAGRGLERAPGNPRALALRSDLRYGYSTVNEQARACSLRLRSY